MDDRSYCEGRVKLLLGAAGILFVATVIGMVYYRGAAPDDSSGDISGNPRSWIAGIEGVVPGGLGNHANFAPGNAGAAAGAPAQRAALTRAVGLPRSLGPLESIQAQFHKAAMAVRPSVVHIKVRRVVSQGGGFAQGRVESIGSGVVVDSRGYILTNYHVVENPLSISVTTYSQRRPVTYPAELIDGDAPRDLAVIRIQGGRLPAAQLGDSSALRVGDWVMAIGSPLDLAQTVSLGIVSAVRGAVRIGEVTYFDLIQTDAHINKGNSGGPLVDIYGQVVGINAAIYAPEGRFTGVGFALPINNAATMLSELRIAPPRAARTLKAQADPGGGGGWLGIQGVSLSPARAARYGVDVGQGVYVTQVLSDSPAQAAGLQPSDAIVGMDGTRVSGLDSLRGALAGAPPGTACDLKVCRGGRVWSVSATLVARP